MLLTAPPVSLTPTQSAIQAALRAFLLNAVPSGVEVIESDDNLVPEPQGTEYIVVTPIRRPRFSTNIDDYADCKFTGSLAGTVLNVTSVELGSIVIGALLFGVNVIDGIHITGQSSGTPGDIGVYTIAPSQTLLSQTLAAGLKKIVQKTEVTFQLDVHSANVRSGSDMAQVITTLFRSGYGVSFFNNINPDITPLYTEEPRKITFVIDQQQYETRLMIEACLHVNQTVSVPQQFADQVVIETIEVEAAYPA